jgi:hypothetical protein
MQRFDPDPVLWITLGLCWFFHVWLLPRSQWKRSPKEKVPMEKKCLYLQRPVCMVVNYDVCSYAPLVWHMHMCAAPGLHQTCMIQRSPLHVCLYRVQGMAIVFSA